MQGAACSIADHAADGSCVKPPASTRRTAVNTPDLDDRMSRSTILTNPPRTPLIGASILAADFADLGRDTRVALDGGADMVHLDVMDGHFVPNLTMGPDLCRSLRRAMPDAYLDSHLMVTDPQQYVDAFAAAGADLLTFHIEAMPEPSRTIEQVRNAGLAVGLAINPPTDVAAIMPWIGSVDLVLVMSVNPGFAGQSFIAEVLDKAVTVRSQLRPDQRLQIDGGVNADTAGACIAAGCDVLVAASAIFRSDDYADAIDGLRRASASPNPGGLPSSTSPSAATTPRSNR